MKLKHYILATALVSATTLHGMDDFGGALCSDAAPTSAVPTGTGTTTRLVKFKNLPQALQGYSASFLDDQTLYAFSEISKAQRDATVGLRRERQEDISRFIHAYVAEGPRDIAALTEQLSAFRPDAELVMRVLRDHMPSYAIMTMSPTGTPTGLLVPTEAEKIDFMNLVFSMQPEMLAEIEVFAREHINSIRHRYDKPSFSTLVRIYPYREILLSHMKKERKEWIIDSLGNLSKAKIRLLADILPKFLQESLEDESSFEEKSSIIFLLAPLSEEKIHFLSDIFPIFLDGLRNKFGKADILKELAGLDDDRIRFLASVLPMFFENITEIGEDRAYVIKCLGSLTEERIRLLLNETPKIVEGVESHSGDAGRYMLFALDYLDDLTIRVISDHSRRLFNGIKNEFSRKSLIHQLKGLSADQISEIAARFTPDMDCDVRIVVIKAFKEEMVAAAAEMDAMVAGEGLTAEEEPSVASYMEAKRKAKWDAARRARYGAQ